MNREKEKKFFGKIFFLSSCVSKNKYTEMELNYNQNSNELVDTKFDLLKY